MICQSFFDQPSLFRASFRRHFFLPPKINKKESFKFPRNLKLSTLKKEKKKITGNGLGGFLSLGKVPGFWVSQFPATWVFGKVRHGDFVWYGWFIFNYVYMRRRRRCVKRPFFFSKKEYSKRLISHFARIVIYIYLWWCSSLIFPYFTQTDNNSTSAEVT